MAIINGSPRNDTLTGTASDDQIYGQEGADNLAGGGGNDRIESGPGSRAFSFLDGGAGNDTLIGGDSGEQLFGGTDNDLIEAGGGDDVLDGGAGNDTLRGGAGDDRFIDYQGDNEIDGGAGEDDFEYVSYGTGTDTITGGAGVDFFRLWGSRLTDAVNNRVDTIADFQAGNSGDILGIDQVTSQFLNWDGSNPFTGGYLRLRAVDADGDGAVDDVVLEGDRDGGGNGYVSLVNLLNVTPGAFTIQNFTTNGFYAGFDPAGGVTTINGDPTFTNGGSRQVLGTQDRDLISGSWQGELISGREGNDTINGGGGNDQIRGSQGADVLDGGSGDDTLYGDDGPDTLNGGDGNDYLEAGSGQASILGGAGDDTIFGSGYWGGATAGVYDGGAGDDLFQFVGASSLTTRSTYTGGAGNDRFQIYARSAAINPNGVFDLITDFETGTGRDRVDLLELSSFTGWSSGQNPFVTGHLRLVAGDADGVGGANDTLLQANLDAVGADWVTILGFVGVAPLSFRFNFTQDGSIANQFLFSPTGAGTGAVATLGAPGTLEGTSGPDNFQADATGMQIRGYGGDDVLSGAEGNDQLFGDDGNDVLTGGAGNDNLYGGSGNDSLNGGDGDDNINTGLGQDTVVAGAGNDTVVMSYAGQGAGDGAKTVNLGAGDDTISSYFSANTIVDTVTLGAGRDSVDIDSRIITTAGVVADTITDFQAGPGGDRLTIYYLRSVFQGYSFDLNPFAAGFMQVVAADADGDGSADDVLVQADRNGPTGGANWTTVANLLNVPLSSLTAQNFADQFLARNFDPFPAVNVAPVQSSDFRFVIVTNTSNSTGSGLGLLRDTVDADGDALTVSIVTAPSAGTFTLNSPTTGQVSYNAAGVAAGTYSFTYAISDGTASVTRTGFIEVLANNNTAFSFTGSDSNNIIVGLNGGDTLDGGDGSDQLYGAGGADSLLGGRGSDYLQGDAGNDTLSGGAGNDNLAGLGDDDSLYGEDGNDTLAGGAGSDLLDGGVGDDTLNVDTEAGTDTIIGGDGADTFNQLSQGLSVSRVTGGTGRDLFNLDIYYRFNNAAANAVDTITDFVVGAGGDIINLENLQFSNRLSNIDIQVDNPFATGHLRFLQSGANTILQGDQDGGGNNWVDLLILENTTASAITRHNIRVSNDSGHVGFDPAGGVFTIAGSELGDGLNGSWGRDSMSGGEGDDFVQGHAGADTLDGGRGRDTLYGEGGNDSLLGGDGADNLQGGENNDTLVGGEGNDTLEGGNGVDLLEGGDGDDRLFDDGSVGAGIDTLNGGAGDDYIQLRYGSNLASGGSGDDVIDVTTFSPGQSTLSGGLGQDVFILDPYYVRFTAGVQAPIITDFTTGVNGDVLRLDNLVAGSRFDGYTLDQNPFTSGFLRLISGDIDGDGADDTRLQADWNGTVGGASFVDLVLLRDTAPGSVVAANFGSNHIWGVAFYSPTGAAFSVNGTERPDNNQWNAAPIFSAGPDLFTGGSGDENVSASYGADTLNGGGGRDTLDGEQGNDQLNGDEGADTLDGGDGNDTLNGGEGDDWLEGGAGADVVNGGTGDDYFYDYRGADTLDGGAGADEFVYLSYDNERAFAIGGEGRDEFSVYGFRLTNPGSYTPDRIMDFQAGSGGDLLIAQSFNLSGWDGVVNPFAGGWLRFQAADVDSDGQVDDLVLQGDSDRSGVTHTWQTVIELVGVNLADLVPSNFQINSRSYSFSGGNALPEAFNDTYSVTEDSTLTVPAAGVLGNDFDAEGASMTAVLNTGPAFGTVTLNANGSFTYTPGSNFSGTDSFTYRANDGTNSGNAATVTINVLPENDAPNAVNDNYSVNQDQTLVRNALQGVRANDSDPDPGTTLTISLLTNVSNGTLSLAADGSFSYTPNAGFFGTDQFTYRASDGSLTDDATVTITVNASNVPPVGNADVYTVAEDGSLTVAVAAGVLANDTDANGNPLTAQLVSNPGNGTFSFNANGSFTFTPNANFNGSTSFTYRPNDGLVNGNLTTVTINVTPVNDAPTADNDGPYAATEDTLLTVSAANGVLVGDADIDGDPLTAVLVSTTTNGTLNLAANGSFTYQPNANFNGTDSFTYQASDGSLTSPVRTVTITVAPVNDAPVAVNDSATIAEDGILTVPVASGVLANDTDADGNPLTAVLVSTVSNGSLSLNANGSYSYVPNANFAGTDSFTYRANDGSANSNIATVTITVTPVNDAPDAVNDTGFTTAFNTPLTIAPSALLANDSDGDPEVVQTLTIQSVQGAVGGTVALDGGQVVFTPTTGFSGAASFTYTINDGAGGTDTATVSLTVGAPGNTAPTITSPASASVAENQSAAIDVDATDPDAGQTLTYSIVGGADAALFAINASTGAVSFLSAPNFEAPADAGGNNVYNIVVRATDNGAGALFAEQAIAITVTNVNEAPVADGDGPYAATEDTVLTVNAANGVLAGDSDPDAGTTLTAQLVSSTVNGTLVLNANGSFTYTPNANFNGVDQFSYRASDGSLTSGVQTVTINVAAVNDAPDAVNDAGFTTAFNTPLTIAPSALLANDSDGDPEVVQTLTIQSVQGAVGGTVALDGGQVVFTPTTGFSGAASFTYTINDGAGGTDTATVSLTVGAPGNTAPTITSPASASVAENQSAAIDVDATDPDAGQTLTYSIVGGADAALFAINASTGAVSFLSAPNFEAPADAGGNNVYNIVVRATDNGAGALFAEQAIAITVTNVNEAPVADGDGPYAATEDTVLTVNAANGVLAGDSDPDAGTTLTAQLVSSTVNGTLVLNANGSFTYTPNANFNGVDQFSYRASDGSLTSGVQTVTINVAAVNDAPDAVNDAGFTTAFNTPLTIAPSALLANDSDGDPEVVQTLTIQSVQGAVGGTVALDGGQVVFTPTTGFSGAASFTYTINDGAGGTDTATVSLTVGTGIARPDIMPGFTPNNDFVDASGRPGPTVFRIDGSSDQADSGRDTIVGFGRNDILSLENPLFDSNNDGIVTFSSNRALDLDQPASQDRIAFVAGPSPQRGLRYLGEDEDGQHLYADARTRPVRAIEGTVADDSLRGDVGDRRSQIFFFDTALDVDWGRDTISRFGARDMLVLTSALYDADGNGAIPLGLDGGIALNGSGFFDPADLGPQGPDAPFGHLQITDLAGQAVVELYLRGTQLHAGVTYNIYGLTPGTVPDLTFLA